MRTLVATRRCRRTVASLALSIAGVSTTATAAIIPPDELFFAPSSLAEQVVPRKASFGEGQGFSPWTLVWTTADVLDVDPGRVDITITGVNILPVLKPNPSPTSEEGEYTDAELAAITVANYPTYYKFTPGTNVFLPNVHYGADLSFNVLVVQIDAPGPWTFRVHTTSRPFAGGPLESKSYLWSTLLGDAYAILPSNAPIPAHVHREISVDDFLLEGGLAGPPGTVHVVSDGDPGDNGAMKNACKTLMTQNKDPQKATGLGDLVMEICEAVAANGGNPVVAKIYAHGNGPAGAAANGLIKVGTEYVCCGVGCTKKPMKLGECLKGKVSRIEIWSCYTGSDGAFLQALANGAGVTVAGFDVALTCGDGYFNTDATGKKKKKDNQACTDSPCVGDLDVNGLVNGADLGLMLGSWAGDGCGDINHDGIVNGSDLGLLLGAWGECPSDAPPQCGQGAGACCSANGGVGCSDEGCCASVCLLDAACCQMQWDALCAEMAVSQINCACPTKPLCGGSATDCCGTGDAGGCSDAACCDTVCLADTYCCQAQWDGVCASEAAGVCGALCDIACLDGAPEGEPCGADTDGGCNGDPPAFRPVELGETVCGTFWADGGTRDTDWYMLDVPMPTFVQLTVLSNAASTLYLVSGGCENLAVIADGQGGTPNSTGACVPPGQYIVFVATQAFDGLPCGSSNSYTLMIDSMPGGCGFPTCGTGPSCFVPHPQPGCAESACCNSVCEIQPFCCEAQWDFGCVNLAMDVCSP